MQAWTSAGSACGGAAPGGWRTTRTRNAAQELESLGYGALWSSGRFDPGLSPHFARLLGSTTTVTVASGIVSVWAGAPEDVGPAVAALEERFPGRFLLGIGASHAPAVADYTRPYSHVVAYLDALDALDVPVPPERRVLAALGPRMLELAAARAAGAHPYFVPVEHTARARGILGPGPLLAPEVAVVLETDATRARELARGLCRHLPAPAELHATTCARFGFGDDDIDGGGSDRLIDAVIPWGDAATIAAACREHHDAGADHVCVQVVAGREAFPLDRYRELAPRSAAARQLSGRRPGLSRYAGPPCSASSARQGPEGAAPVRHGVLLGRRHLGEGPAVPVGGHEHGVVPEAVPSPRPGRRWSRPSPPRPTPLSRRERPTSATVLKRARRSPPPSSSAASSRSSLATLSA